MNDSMETGASKQVRHPNDSTEVAIVSIAISLRRIADVICGDKDHMDLSSTIGNAIEQAILSATRR